MKSKKGTKGKKKEKNMLLYYGFTKADQKKYPVVSGILRQLTPEIIKREIEAIQKVELPSELQKWVKEYKEVGERDEFIWKWAFRAIQLIIYSSVTEKYQKSLEKTKFLMLMFIVLLDDVSDKMKNRLLLDGMLQISLQANYPKVSLLNQKEIKYLKFAAKIHRCIVKTIKKYPRYEEFKDIFDYDFDQIINTMKYAIIINNNHYLINKVEYWMYFSHNMQGMISYTIDLMCSPKFNICELGLMRKVTWYAQQMCRIGNWLTTWEREINDKDFTSGVFAYAIDNNIIDVVYLQKNEMGEIIKKIKGSTTENNLLKEWNYFYNQINKLNNKNRSIDIKKILLGLKRWIIMEMSTKGYR